MATALSAETAFSGWSHWADAFPTLPALAGTIPGVAYAVFLLAVTFYYFYTAPMPEVANRSAFWTATTSLMLLSVVLLTSSSEALMVSGTVIQFAALAIVAYGVNRYRLVDIRDTVLVALRTLTFIVAVWILLFGTLYFSNRLDLLEQLSRAEIGQGSLVIAAIALLLTAFIIPIRQIIDFAFSQVMTRIRPNLALATAEFNKRVARASNLQEVVIATSETLMQVMQIQSSALILISHTFRMPDAVELIVLNETSTVEQPASTGYISKNSPIYRTLAFAQVALGQFDVDYGPIYQSSTDDEKEFFRSLKMSVYIPITAEGRLIGILACGSKPANRLYHRNDIELLSVIGQQVGTALRSARLIDDLQHLNETMRSLNRRLERAKQDLEKLDAVKTDFITIASHELRTPLAQVRGYTDIIDSLNDGGALQTENTRQMVNNLRKSTERMEELISAMLDVSQLDVNAMDLRFVRTSPETITRLALDPLRDAAAQRNITIERAEFTGLPHIEADLQRMVQALRNLVLNAIKFTPDGGHITISAELEQNPATKSGDAVLFRIQDTGVGIDKKDIEFIFNKFYRGFDTQLHSTGLYKFMGAGPGLGLTIAKGIIEGHGGKIWAESPGHNMQTFPGTTFFVRLPLQPPAGVRRVMPFEEDAEKRENRSVTRAGLKTVEAGQVD
jgi:signal transduction histidine kinase